MENITPHKHSTLLENGLDVIRQVVKTLSSHPGVYRMINHKGDVLYVGKAKNLKKRVASYTLINKLPNRLRRMVAETTRMEIVITLSEIEALLLESNLIKQFQPQYNILLKDDKSFPYVHITTDQTFPRIVKHRGPLDSKGRYFGPFASSSAVDECLTMLQKVFLLRNCSDEFFANRTRPCLQYHIKRCSAPCVNKIGEDSYQELVEQAVDYLSGKSDTLQQYLAERMLNASERLAFEEAVVYRDRIRLLSKLQSKQRVNIPDISDADIIAGVDASGYTCFQVFFFRNGQNFGSESLFLKHTEEATLEEKFAAFLNQFYTERPPAKLVLLSHQPAEFPLIKQALCERHKFKIKFEIPQLGQKKELIDHALSNGRETIQRKFAESASFERTFDEIATLFKLNKRPQRIEIYDNSHLQGSNPYGVMVVADEKGLNKKLYRKFTIKTSQPSFGGDDYGMMREVLLRRFARAAQEDWNLPDLILIDGGQGQLNVACDVVRELSIEGVTVVGIAKGPERNAGRERFFMVDTPPFDLPHNSPILHFLQRLRDEAHRFAIGSHRTGRQKQLVKSRLDDIPGIGPARKKALLQSFGSVRAISSASLEDLLRVGGINKSIAKIIYQYFHGS